MRTLCTTFVQDRTQPTYHCLVPMTISLVVHLYEFLACLALISLAFVCVVVHVTLKGYPIRCYGATFGYPVQGPPLSVVSQTFMSTSMERDSRARSPSPPPSPRQPALGGTLARRARAGRAPGIFCDPCPTGGLLLVICRATLYGFVP